MNIEEDKVYENSITPSIKRKTKNIVHERMKIINDTIINKNPKCKDAIKSFIKIRENYLLGKEMMNLINEQNFNIKNLSNENKINELYYNICGYANMHNDIFENFAIKSRLIKLFEPFYNFIRKTKDFSKLNFNDKFILDLVKYLTQDYNDFFINIIKGDECYIDEYIRKKWKFLKTLI